MASQKYDVVVEAVRYQPDGLIDCVRAYERHGAAYSDLRLLRRSELVERLKAGQRVVVGQRIQFMAGTFRAIAPVRLLEPSGGNGQAVLVTTQPSSDRDELIGAPLF